MGFTDGKDLFAILARQRTLKAHRTCGQLDWLTISLPQPESSLFWRGPKIDSTFGPLHKDEKSSILSPVTEKSLKHFAEPRPVCSGLHDYGAIDLGIKLAES